MRRVARGQSSPPLHEADWDAFLTRSIGVSVTARHWEMCEPAIRRAMQRIGLTDGGRYRALVERDSEAFDSLVDELTVGETYFFRDRRQFDFLRSEVIPQLVTQLPETQPLVVWSVGCASGEEPYSLAILFKDMGLADRVKVIGTDVSRTRLDRARHATYSKWSMRGVSKATIDRYFTRHDGAYRPIESIRSAVTFAEFNLVEANRPSPVPKAHIILCRNVLIYFDRSIVTPVTNGLVDTLADGGWLVLGPSDPILTDVTGCEPVSTGAGLAYHRTSLAESRPRYRSDIAFAAVQVAPRVAPPVPDDPLSWMTDPVEDRQNAPAGHQRDADLVSPARPVASEPATEPRPTDVLALAQRLRAEGKILAAADAAQRYVDGPGLGEPNGWALLVRSLADLGRTGPAGRACAAAIAMHPRHPELLILWSVLLAGTNRHDEAIVAARQAVYIERELAMGHLALGDAFARAGDAAGARRALAMAVRLLEAMAPTVEVPASGGETAARLVGAVRSRLSLLAPARA